MGKTTKNPEEKIRIVLDGLRDEAGLQDQSPKPKNVWDNNPDEVRHKDDKLALQERESSPRELAVTFTDREKHFVSNAIKCIERIPDPIGTEEDYEKAILETMKAINNVRKIKSADTKEIRIRLDWLLMKNPK